MVDEKTIEELRALLAKATPGPWEVDYLDKNGQRVIRQEHIEIATFWHHSVGSIEKEMEANAALTVAMRNALPSLLARIEALTVERDQWQSRAQTAWDQMDADMRRSIETAIAALEPEVPMSDAIQQERDRLARILEAEALKRSPLTDNGVTQRVTYAIAARIVGRGRALTDREKLENLMRGLEDIEDDEAPTK